MDSLVIGSSCYVSSATPQKIITNRIGGYKIIITFTYRTVGFMSKNCREHIMETSLMLFLQRGFKAVTMNDIVNKLGLSKGAFYHYFKSKEQVFEEVVNYFYKDIFTQNFDSFSTDSLKAFCEDFLKDVDRKFLSVRKIGKDQKEELNINHYLLIFDAIALLPSFKKLQRDQGLEELKRWKNIIRSAKLQGEINTSFSDEQIAKMFIYMGDGFGMHIIFDTVTNKNMRAHQKEIRKLWKGLYELLKT